MVVIDNLQTKCYLQKTVWTLIIYVITRVFTSIKIKWNVQNGPHINIKITAEILAYWKFKIETNGNSKNAFLLTYSLILVIKLKLFQYIIISHNCTKKLGLNIFMRTKINSWKISM
jgi:hypothetical protein